MLPRLALSVSIGFGLLLPTVAEAAPRRATPVAAYGDTIASIQVSGTQRIDPSTVQSYMLVQPGDRFDPERLDRTVKTLFATGLFRDVSLDRRGDTLLVRVVENPVVNRISFEGNKKLTDDQLRPDLQLRPRAVYTAALAQADRQKILDAYAKKGRYDARVEPKIVRLDQNRVDVIFEIAEGDNTLTSRIAFVGNHAFDENRLREVINSRETRWWRFLSSADVYDPERVNFDRELLRRFYLRNGYVDFEVRDATAELAADRSAFFLTFAITEGERYRVGKVALTTTLRHLDAEDERPNTEVTEGDWYDGDTVERTVTAVTNDLEARGFPFADVKPRIKKNRETHTIDLTFELGDGPHVYVERIDVVGNTATEDKVVRREFRFAEGYAFNPSLGRLTKTRIQDLGYFGTVTVTPSPGSAPDRAVVTATVEEKATGELSLGGGYSTDAGLLLDVGLRQRNLLGTGVDASVSGVVAQKRSSVDVSVTDPYFLDRNLVAGVDVFYINTNNQNTAQYSERRYGTALRTGFEYNEHLRQAFNYTIANRNVFDVSPFASFYIAQQAGVTLLSQIGQTFTVDYRDSRTEPHQGFITRLGADFAGVGGDERYLRTKVDATYYYPLDRYLGDDFGLSISGGTGYLFGLGKQEQIIDRFFLGGDNLRGFQSGGVGPHDLATGDSLGGRFIYNQSTELKFPLPISADIGLTGRSFVDVGALSQASFENGRCNVSPELVANVYTNYRLDSKGCPPTRSSASPRLGAGVGVSWKSPFGLINIDITPFVISKPGDQKQLFRFGFGTKF